MVAQPRLPRGRRPAQRGADRGLVVLRDLAAGQIEFQPVAVGGNMAAGDHHRRPARRLGRQRQRRGRQRAAIDHLDAAGPGGPGHRIGDLGRGRPQIATEIEPATMRTGQEKGAGVFRDQVSAQLGDKTAQAAGAEFGSHDNILCNENALSLPWQSRAPGSRFCYRPIGWSDQAAKSLPADCRRSCSCRTRAKGTLLREYAPCRQSPAWRLCGTLL